MKNLEIISSSSHLDIYAVVLCYMSIIVYADHRKPDKLNTYSSLTVLGLAFKYKD